MKLLSSIRHCLLAFLLLGSGLPVMADGSAVDKIYHPYVEQLEWELEWRMLQDNENPVSGEQRPQTHLLGLGRAIAEFVFVEGYLIGQRSADRSLDLYAYEVELLWQITEQGEYSLDYGLLFELEREHNEDVWEYATKLLLEKELGRYSVTANLGLIYEWGDDIKNEWETSLALQARYRYSPRFEPALELYAGENSRALGPAMIGVERLGVMRALRWELALVFGLTSDSADYTLRAGLEYEF
jgi:hypothetical protein